MTNETKEKLLIVGSGGFGRVTYENALTQYNCSFVDDGYEIGTDICGAKVVGKISDLAVLKKDFDNLAVSIGNNDVRGRIYTEAKTLGYRFPNVVCGSAYISPFASVGEGCVILNNAVVQNGAKVGNGVILNPGVEVHHDSQVGNNVCIYTNSVVRTYARVGDFVKIGSNVTITNEATVNEHEAVDDGMVVRK